MKKILCSLLLVFSLFMVKGQTGQNIFHAPQIHLDTTYYKLSGNTGDVITLTSNGAEVWAAPIIPAGLCTFVDSCLGINTSIGDTNKFLTQRGTFRYVNGQPLWEFQNGSGPTITNITTTNSFKYQYGQTDSSVVSALFLGNLTGYGLPDTSIFLLGNYFYFASPKSIFGSVSLPVYTLQIGDTLSPSSFGFFDGSTIAAGQVLTRDSNGGAHWVAPSGGSLNQYNIGVGNSSNQLAGDYTFIKDSRGNVILSGTTNNFVRVVDTTNSVTFSQCNADGSVSLVGNNTTTASINIRSDSVAVDYSINFPSMQGDKYTTFVNDGNGNLSWKYPVTNGATGSEPSSPYLGQFYFDTTLTKMKFWNGTTWAVITSTP